MAFKINDACIACGSCKESCPAGAIKEGDVFFIEADSCMDCGACADSCPAGAIVPED